MTWLGIVLVIYYALNIVAAFFYAGKGGMWTSSGSLIFSACVSAAWIVGLLTVGTNA